MPNYFQQPTPFQPDYQVLLISPTGTQIAVLDMSRIQSLAYSRVLNGHGQFSMTMSIDDPVFDYLDTLDLIVEIYRQNIYTRDLRVEATYFSRFYNIFENEDGQEFVIIAGNECTELLSTRIIRIEDDPNNAGGYVTYFGAADTVMRELVLYQCVTPANDSARAIPGFSVAAVSGVGYPVFPRESYTVLLDVLKNLAYKGNVDFRVTRLTGASFVFEALPIGTDRTYTNNYPSDPYILFDPKRGNLFTPNLMIDRKDEKTFCYVMGQGLEDERYIFPVNVSSIGDSPFNRREVTTDARNQEDDQTDGLIAAGLETLNDQGTKTEFSFVPDLNAPQGAYNIHWFLGDKVTAMYRNYQQDLRIIQVDVQVDGEGESVSPVLEQVIRV